MDRGGEIESTQGLTTEKTLNQLPKTEGSLVLRTDFSDESAWTALCEAIRKPVGEFQAFVELVSDPQYNSLTVEQMIRLNPEGDGHTFAFVVDQTALTDPDHPILVVDLFEEPGRTFRVIPSEMWGVENNLSISNMDFCDFADAVDLNGVFRGFP
jgi:hypothetical protein